MLLSLLSELVSLLFIILLLLFLLCDELLDLRVLILLQLGQESLEVSLFLGFELPLEIFV